MMTRRFQTWLWLAAALTAVGCTLDAAPSDPIYVIVTNTAPPSTAVAQAPIAEPTAIPIIDPTAVPTPAIPAAQALQAADRDLIDGYFERAALTYASIIDQPDTSSDQRAAAAFGAGLAALREGLFAVAVDSLTRFIDGYPDDPRLAQAHLLRGDAYLGLSNWDAAGAEFERYLALRPGLIDSYVFERLADIALARGENDAALAAYDRAIAAGRTLTPLLALRERAAQVAVRVGRTDLAVAQYDAILGVAQNTAYRADIAYRAAQTLLDANDTGAGLVRMSQVFSEAPQTVQGFRAGTALRAAGVEVDAYQYGQAAFAAGDYRAAVEAFNSFASTRASVGEIPARLHLLLGRAYREIGNPQAAITAFQTIIDSYTSDPLFGDALLEQGRTRFLNNDIPGAISAYLRIADTYDYLPQAAEALWRAGYLHATNGRAGDARILFERLADRYPDTPQAKDGLFLAASSAMRDNAPAAAERYYAELAVKTTGEDQAFAYFSVGRLALDRGDQALAQQAFAGAVSAAPDSFFSARAADLVAGIAPFTPPPVTRFDRDDADAIAEAEAWMRTVYGITTPGSLATLPPELASEPRLLRGVELWTVGAYDPATIELIDLVLANQTDALASYRLAVYLRDIGAYYPSILASSYVIRNANVGTLDAPGYLARLRYPAYYSDVIVEASAAHGADPLLLMALIRQESLFNTYATAAADEKGMTQVIPPTGDYIAQRLNFPNYTHSVLFRPYAAAAFGAYYLGEQLRLFDGDATAALAAYNAGPGRALQWREIAGSDPDAFMATITINSTRTYVQRIYSNYTIYRALYGG